MSGNNARKQTATVNLLHLQRDSLINTKIYLALPVLLASFTHFFTR